MDHAALVGDGEPAAEAVVGGERRRVDPGKGYHVGFPGLRQRSSCRRQITPAGGGGQHKSALVTDGRKPQASSGRLQARHGGSSTCGLMLAAWGLMLAARHPVAQALRYSGTQALA